MLEQLEALEIIQANHEELDFVCHVMELSAYGESMKVFSLVHEFADDIVGTLIDEGIVSALGIGFGEQAVEYIERKGLVMPEEDEWE